MFTKRSLTHESGQALIQVALAMVVLLAFVALAIEVGSLYAERRKMQNAADAGALAGAMVLCSGGDAGADALKLAKANGVQPQDVVITFPDSNTISVVVSTTAHSIFARILSASFANTLVRAKATAKCGPVSTVGNGLFPLIVKDDPLFKIGNDIILQISEANNYGWLSWNGDQSAGYLAQEFNLALSGGDLPHAVSTGDWVTATTGFNNSHDVRKAVSQFVGTTVIMPLFDVYRGTGGNTEYHIVGYAAFNITHYKSTGTCSETDNVELTTCSRLIRGSFVERTIPSSSSGGPACTICDVHGATFTQ